MPYEDTSQGELAIGIKRRKKMIGLRELFMTWK